MVPDNRENQVKALVSLALRYLSIRNRSTQELSNYLFSKSKNSSELAEVAMQRISQFNLLNDAEFAQNWIQMRLNQGKGPRLIDLELKRKGIPPDLINHTLHNVPENIWFDSAKALLERKQVTLIQPISRAAKAKAYRYLTSRGFSSGTVYAVIDAVGAI